MLLGLPVTLAGALSPGVIVEPEWLAVPGGSSAWDLVVESIGDEAQALRATAAKSGSKNDVYFMRFPWL